MTSNEISEATRLLIRCRDSAGRMEMSLYEDIQNFLHRPETPKPTNPMTVIEVPINDITLNKELRRDIDAQIQRLKSATQSRERSIAITKMQEAVMWLGMDLKRINDARGVTFVINENNQQSLEIFVKQYMATEDDDRC